MKKTILILLGFVCITAFGQQHKQRLLNINKDVWQPFTKAFETYDNMLFKSIHCEDLIRISGNSKHIKDIDDYMLSYNSWDTTTDRKQTISFRFIERITSDNKASERGIYRLTVNVGTDEEQSYYGKFHVLLRKENDTWKIAMDYDSNEGNTINEESYLEAFAFDDMDKY